jgi:hypothetical protein
MDDSIFLKDPSTWRCKISMALSVVITKLLWCCMNAVGLARQHGRQRQCGWCRQVGSKIGCWIVWNRTLPHFRHWGLLPDWREDWLMEREIGVAGACFVWRLFVSLRSEG